MKRIGPARRPFSVLATTLWLILLVSCGPAQPTLVPTSLATPPTHTAIPPTATTAIPTDTPRPTAAPATATPLPPLDGRGGGIIVFASYLYSRGELYLMNADGTGLRQLTHTLADSEYYPTWSPDGMQIAFSSEPDGGKTEIYVLDIEQALQNPDGVQAVQLTNNNVDDENPAWSPDGTQLVFESTRDGNREIYIVNADGSDPQRLTDNGAIDLEPDWSPDGTQIAFSSWRDGNAEIYVMAVPGGTGPAGSEPRRLTSNRFDDFGPAWSPDGTKIAFYSTRNANQDIYVMNADGTDERRLTYDLAADQHPSWSPDGTQIIFTRQLAIEGTPGIYVMRASGSNQQQLVRAEPGQSSWRPSTAPPLEIPSAAHTPVAGPATTRSEPPTTKPPLETPERENPPADAVLGDTWIRPANGMVLLYVPGGTFQMGSTLDEVEAALSVCREHYNICNRSYYMLESPQHTVAVDGFWLDQTEVTNAQYRRCVAAGACQRPRVCQEGHLTYDDPSKGDHPVVCVTWDDAQSYCAWAGARLPTEAEWEYAARGEQGNTYPWGDAFDGTVANYCDASCDKESADARFDDGHAETAPVGTFPQGASWCGALDLAGNVYEWAVDWIGPYPQEAQSNPTGPLTGSEKVLRGGSWFMHPTRLRGAARGKVAADTRQRQIGFRCAVSATR